MTERWPFRANLGAFYFAAVCILASSLTAELRAGYVEDRNGKTIIYVKLHDLPDPAMTDTISLAKAAVVRSFVEKFPAIFKQRHADRYKADPKRYGNHNWDNVEIRLRAFTGISIEGADMDSRPLMAIAGGVAPDVIYVNFRQSETYISQGFLYPLDKPEDRYFTALSEEEKRFWVHPKIMPVIHRRAEPGQKKHIWAVPMGGVMGKVMLYRKDVLEEAGVKFPTNDWTWEDLYQACRKISDPAKGRYGIVYTRGMGGGDSQWTNFLWSAGGDVMEYNPQTDQWQATFNSHAGTVALDFYLKLIAEPWVDDNGRKRYGYAARTMEDNPKWELGQAGFMPAFMDDRLFSIMDPATTGMVPVPIGPTGIRAGELNCRMQGIFSGVKDAVVRDAAWEYLRYTESKEGMRIYTEKMVEGGLGHFVNPEYLRMFGYESVVRLVPREWKDVFRIAIDTGKPEPYGRNCQLIYRLLGEPICEAERMALAGELPNDREKRMKVLAALLDRTAQKVNEKMIGNIPPDQMQKRRRAAGVALGLLAVTFCFVFRKVAVAFSPPRIEGPEKRGRWRFRKYAWAYILLIPAVLSIFLWQYLPLAMGSKMAFQDYRIVGQSVWVGLDNFANLLWDADWWTSVYNSLRYSVLVIALTFLPPVTLAVVLQEIPRFSVFFRVLFYLPAVISGLVVIYLWRSFYEPTEFGVLNAVIMQIPAIGFLAIGLVLFGILFLFAKRLWLHEIRWVSALCFLAGVVLFAFFYRFASPILFPSGTSGTSLTELPSLFHRLFMTLPQPYRWLLDPDTAMFCCVLPIVWAGMGPGCLIYLAALKGVAPDFYEAADIDGATFIDKILFVVIPILKPLLIIQFIGVFIGAWMNSAFILAMTGGGSNTEVADLHIFYKAYMHLKFGPATAMAWILGFMLIGFTVYQLRILSRLEFKTTGDKP